MYTQPNKHMDDISSLKVLSDDSLHGWVLSDDSLHDWVQSGDTPSFTVLSDSCHNICCDYPMSHLFMCLHSIIYRRRWSHHVPTYNRRL